MTPGIPRSNGEVSILIAEDSATQAQQLRHTLERHGFHVTHAANGREALDATLRDKPSLVISDIIMPEMDGYELCRRIKEDPILGDLPVILVTTLSDPSDVIRGLQCRADNFILKPYDDRYLLSRVQYVLLNRQMRESQPGGLAVEIFFNGQRHLITADRLQILNLLLSTYDAAIERNRELTRVQEQLSARTAELTVRHKELHESRTFLENLIAASPSLITRLEWVEETVQITYASPNVAPVLGYGFADVLRVPNFWVDILHPDDRDAAVEVLRTLFRGATPQIEVEQRCRAKNGEYLWFLTTLRGEAAEDGRIAAVLCHALDITARKRAEQALVESEERTRRILSTAHDAFIGIDDGGLIIEWNVAAERVFGWPRAAALGRPIAELVLQSGDRERHNIGLERLGRGGEGPILNKRIEVSVLRRDGEQFPAELIVWPIDVGERRLFNAFVRDITQQKLAEAAVREAKDEAERANRAKSEFLSRMSHDLRTPLNAIVGFAQLLESEGPHEDQREALRHILKGGAHLLDLINEVLDIARIEVGHLSLSPEPVRIANGVADVIDLVRPLAAQRRIALQVDTAVCRDQHVLADRQRLNQILLNLLSNAVKYNHEGGRVMVTCEQRPENRVRIKVTDTGAGIPPAKLQLLFQPFERLGAEQTTIEGTGLGLALSKALAEAMGGALGVESVVDGGSTFWVELAVAEDAGVEAAAAPAADRAVLSENRAISGTVLYIEDNVSNQRLMERVIARRPGVRLVSVAQGQAGLDLARTRAPDLILLDLHLPDLRGEDVLQRLWQNPQTRSIPVAVLSADATRSQVGHLLAAGACAYLTKPLNIAEVLQLVDRILRPSM
jgi:PAS domain S-box-containing protein